MQTIQYTGPSDSRIVTAANLVELGIVDQATDVVFNKANNYTVSVPNDVALVLLTQFGFSAWDGSTFASDLFSLIPAPFPSAGPSYNMHPANFPNLRAAYANVKAGVSDLNIVAAGDSLSRGYGAANRSGLGWPDAFASEMALKGYPAVNGAVIGANGADAGQLDPRSPSVGSMPSGWTQQYFHETYGVFWGGDFCSWSGAVGAAANLVITPMTLADTYDIYWTNNVTGTFKAQATGGALTTITENSGGGYSKTTITAGSASLANTVTFSAVATASCTILAVVGRLSTKKQMIVHNCAVAGTILNGAAGKYGWGSQVSAFGHGVFDAFLPVASILSLSPSLCIFPIGDNDFGVGGYSADQWFADMSWVKNQLNAGGCDLLIVTEPTTGPSSFYAESTIGPEWEAIKANCFSQGWPVFDSQARYKPWSSYSSMFFTDQTHMVRQGYDDWGIGLAKCIETVL